MTDQYLSVDLEPGEAEVVLRVSGEIDMGSAPSLLEAQRDANDVSQSVTVVDLSRVGFIDSTGISALITMHQDLEAHGKELVLRGATGTVRRVLEISGLDKILKIE